MDETKLDNGSAAANEGMDKAAGTSVFINSKKENIFKPIQAVSGVVPVSYTHLTLPTNSLV